MRMIGKNKGKQMRSQNTPQLRVMLTDKCNLSCLHCRKGGEGKQSIGDNLSDKELLYLLQLCAEVGFSHVKFTGGEPLLRPSATELMKEISRRGFYEDVQLVTNGQLLVGNENKIRQIGLSLLTVSLDAVDTKKHRMIRGCSSAPVISGLKACREKEVPVRINMIVMKCNFDQIPLMLDVAGNYGCSLKLLDLICLQGINAWQYWKKEYLHFECVREYLIKKGAEFIGKEEAPGGIGAPLDEYKMPNGVHVLLKDSTQGTFYHDSCSECIYYPCQDALISARLTADGFLKRCLIRDDNLEPLVNLYRSGMASKTFEAAARTFDILCQSVYHPFAWNPTKIGKKPIT
jgi:cyclic pyranopterin phosphate synthase